MTGIPNIRPLEAIQNLREARDSFGLKVRLLSNPTDLYEIRAAISRLGACFEPGATFFGAKGELAAARNLRLLATLLEERLDAEQQK